MFNIIKQGCVRQKEARANVIFCNKCSAQFQILNNDVLQTASDGQEGFVNFVRCPTCSWALFVPEAVARKGPSSTAEGAKKAGSKM